MPAMPADSGASSSGEVCYVFDNGDRVHYTKSGDKGSWMEYADGTKQYYKGLFERVVRMEYPDGTTVHYNGARGCEREVRVEHAITRRTPTSPRDSKAAQSSTSGRELPEPDRKMPQVPSYGVTLLGRARDFPRRTAARQTDPSTAASTSALPKLSPKPPNISRQNLEPTDIRRFI